MGVNYFYSKQKSASQPATFKNFEGRQPNTYPWQRIECVLGNKMS